MVDGNVVTNASTDVPETAELIQNTCPGIDLGTISKVEIRIHGWEDEADPVVDILMQPIFPGGNGLQHDCGDLSVEGWSNWIDITADINAPSPWTWVDVQNTGMNVISDFSGIGMNYASKVELKVTYGSEASKTKTFNKFVKFKKF